MLTDGFGQEDPSGVFGKRLLRAQGGLTAMRMRFTALRAWIPFLPQPLDDEIRTISKWAEKDQGAGS